MFRLLALFCFWGLVTGQTTVTQQCTGNPGNQPINMYVEGCITPPCVFPQLEYAVLNVVFKAPRTMTSMKTLATAYLFVGSIALPVPYDLGEQSITCNFLENTYCPIIKDEVVQYALHMYIEPFFPAGTSVTIEFFIVDQDSNPVLCVRLAVRIDPPRGARSENLLNGTVTVV